MTKTKAQQIMAATEVRAADDVTAAIQDIAAEFEPYIIKPVSYTHLQPYRGRQSAAARLPSQAPAPCAERQVRPSRLI